MSHSQTPDEAWQSIIHLLKSVMQMYTRGFFSVEGWKVWHSAWHLILPCCLSSQTLTHSSWFLQTLCICKNWSCLVVLDLAYICVCACARVSAFSAVKLVSGQMRVIEGFHSFFIQSVNIMKKLCLYFAIMSHQGCDEGAVRAQCLNFSHLEAQLYSAVALFFSHSRSQACQWTTAVTAHKNKVLLKALGAQPTWFSGIIFTVYSSK